MDTVHQVLRGVDLMGKTWALPVKCLQLNEGTIQIKSVFTNSDDREISTSRVQLACLEPENALECHFSEVTPLSSETLCVTLIFKSDPSSLLLTYLKRAL